MDEETKEAIKDFKDDNKIAHDEIKVLIKCLPCDRHDVDINRNNSRLAVLESQKSSITSKLDWKIMAIMGGVITTLVYLIEKIVIR